MRVIPPGSDEQIRDVVRRAEAEYRSRFDRWDGRASVRVKPQRVLDPGGSDGELFFPPELCPIASHPLIPQDGGTSRNRLLIQRLYQYLHFTTVLEAVAVIPVSTSLSLNTAGLALPSRMRQDAFKITTDEAWHAQFSFDLITQVSKQTAVPYDLPASLPFIERLDRIRSSLEPGLHKLCDLVFAVVSETLISSLLADIPRDRRIRLAVRDIVADHAEDEGKHHAYFRSLLQVLWHAMTRQERRALGPLVPELISAFLDPDLPNQARSLIEIGVPAVHVDQIIAESCPPERTTKNVRVSSQATVRYFAEVGALDDPATLDAFTAAELTLP